MFPIIKSHEHFWNFKKKIIKRNILNDPGKRLFNFLSFPPESSNIGRLPSADSSTRHRKKEFPKNAVWGSDFEYPIQSSKYSLPIAHPALCWVLGCYVC